jgi:hypothetical protein
MFEELVRDVDCNCLEAEQNKKLSTRELRESRAVICNQAIGKLVNFAAFEVAERALSENIVALERLSRNPEQVQMLQKMKQAQRDLQEGIEATRRMILDRCKMREHVPV